MEPSTRFKTFILLLFFLSSYMSLNAQTCLPDGIVINSQSQIDSFPINYPDCIEVLGTVNIYGNNITNLDSLSGLIRIYGDLIFGNNDSLVNFEGLYNLSYIDGNLAINFHDNLESLAGFSNLDSIGGSLILFSNNITDLTGLENIKSIGEYLRVDDNYYLESLDGIENIKGESILRLSLTFNPHLSICHVQSVCDHLLNPSQTPAVYGNNEGCISVQEIMDACIVDVTEQSQDLSESIYPNPFTTTTTIEFELYTRSNIQYTVYNSMGELVYEKHMQNLVPGTHTVTLPLQHLPAGLYYGVFRNKEGVSVTKLIKQ